MTTADAIRSVLISPNTYDSNLEPANLVDVVDRVAVAICSVSNAVRPADAGAYRREGPNAATVNSLTEAVIDLSESMLRISESLHEIAVAIHEK